MRKKIMDQIQILDKKAIVQAVQTKTNFRTIQSVADSLQSQKFVDAEKLRKASKSNDK